LSLPTNDDDLSTSYSAQELINVSSSNDVWVSQEATSNYAIHQFKNFVGSYATVHLTCELQSTFAPSISPVYLQIYHQVNGWETVATNNTAAASTDFLLTATVTLAGYKNAQDVIACRVYQVDI
jgi:hypothetical protein